MIIDINVLNNAQKLFYKQNNFNKKIPVLNHALENMHCQVVNQMFAIMLVHILNFLNLNKSNVLKTIIVQKDIIYNKMIVINVLYNV